MDLGPLLDNRFGIPASAPAASTPSGLSSVAAPSAHAQAEHKLLSPSNPMLAFGVLGALTFGLMAFSTSVRVGHTTASVAVGS